MERLLICGDRYWQDGSMILKQLKRIHQVKGVETVIEGEAKGADTLGRLAAENLGIPVLKFPADWLKYGKAAGPIRNTQMLKEGKPTVVFAFHDDINNSKGTKNMIAQAKKAGIKTFLFYHECSPSSGID